MIGTSVLVISSLKIEYSKCYSSIEIEKEIENWFFRFVESNLLLGYKFVNSYVFAGKEYTVDALT